MDGKNYIQAFFQECEQKYKFVRLRCTTHIFQGLIPNNYEFYIKTAYSEQMFCFCAYYDEQAIRKMKEILFDFLCREQLL